MFFIISINNCEVNVKYKCNIANHKKLEQKNKSTINKDKLSISFNLV